MPIVKPKTHTVIDMYKKWHDEQMALHPEYISVYDSQLRQSNIRSIYKRENGKMELVMCYTQFRLIIETCNKYAAEHIIQGRRLDLGSKLGHLFAACIERSFVRPKVDVISTIQLRRSEHDHPAVYHTDDYYIRIKWRKNRKIKNETVYTFVTASKTFKKDFSQANKTNPLLKTNYQQFSNNYIRKTA